MVRNQAKPLKYSEKKVVFRTNLEQIFKHMTTILNIWLTMMQQALTCALKNARLLPDVCCYLNDKGNEILFRINIFLPLVIITGLDGAGQWLGLPGHRTSHHWTSSYGATLKPLFTFCQLILKRILLTVLLRQQQPGIFECTCESLHHRRLCVQVVAIC